MRAVDFFHAREGIDLAHRLIVTNAQNAREAQGEAAVVAVRSHDIVEGDLENHERLDQPRAAKVFERVFEKELETAARSPDLSGRSKPCQQPSAYRHRGPRRYSRSACRPVSHDRIQPLSRRRRAWPARASASTTRGRAVPADRCCHAPSTSPLRSRALAHRDRPVPIGSARELNRGRQHEPGKKVRLRRPGVRREAQIALPGNRIGDGWAANHGLRLPPANQFFECPTAFRQGPVAASIRPPHRADRRP